jgi:hypothetical protein
VRGFCADDAGYLAWLDPHPDGYVINIAHSLNGTGARVHHAGCRTISAQKPLRRRVDRTIPQGLR